MLKPHQREHLLNINGVRTLFDYDEERNEHVCRLMACDKRHPHAYTEPSECVFSYRWADGLQPRYDQQREVTADAYFNRESK
jgi:hypothetical protein